MKKYMLLCTGLLCLMLLLLSACHSAMDTPEQATAEETNPEAFSQDSASEAPTEPPQNELGEATAPAETEKPWETIEPVAQEKIHTASLTVKEAGELEVSAFDLIENIGREETHVRVVPSLGYACIGFKLGETCYEGDTVPISQISDGAPFHLLIDYATHELPIVDISVDGLAIDSKENYVSMTFTLRNTEKELLALPGGIRLRGNSTAEQPKKPYRIKFDQKQSLFGLEKAKSWVLLAEYLDPSCLHNYAAMYLGAASEHLAFTPTIHHVNLYLDGEYMGLYSICEQVQEQRLGIEQEITADMKELMDFSFLVCMNERAPEEDQPYFYVASVGRYFQLKYPERENFTSENQFKRFMNQLETYYNEMAGAFRNGSNAWFRSNIHTEPLLDQLIIDQIMGEEDHVWKSFYTYHDADDDDMKGKLNFGPIWDYDYSLYTPWTGEPNECYDVDTAVIFSNFFYQGIMGSRYADKVASRYAKHYADQLSACIKHLQEYHDSIETSLALNQARWYSYDPDLTEDNFDFMIKFLMSRQRVLGKLWDA